MASKRGVSLIAEFALRGWRRLVEHWQQQSGRNSLLPKPTHRSSRHDLAHTVVSPILEMEFVAIPAGEFWMGAAQSDSYAHADERPEHHVRITQPFYLGRYPVTRKEFRSFVQETDYVTDAERAAPASSSVPPALGLAAGTWRDPGFAQTDQHPVVHVSWNDAVAFCEWLSQREGKPYRLPTEAEWEYACRAATTTRWSLGDDEETLGAAANIADLSLLAVKPTLTFAKAWDDGYPFTAPVGQFAPNAFGLFDMHGNVWEWCQDWYGETYYASAPGADPPGPAAGTDKVSRGGSWYDRPVSCRSAFRYGEPPHTHSHFQGFRVARGSARD